MINPRPLRNLALVDQLESMNPLVSSQVLNLTHDDTPQIYALCGVDNRSSMKVLRHGLSLSEMASSELPAQANNIWTVGLSAQGICLYHITPANQQTSLIRTLSFPFPTRRLFWRLARRSRKCLTLASWATQPR